MGAPEKPPAQCMHCGSPYVTPTDACLSCGAYPARARRGEALAEVVPDPDLIGGEFRGPF